MLTLGQSGLAIGLIGAVVAAVALLIGRINRSEQASRFGYYLTFASILGVTLSTLVLVVAFFTKDYSFAYVAANHSTDVSSLSWLYTLSGLWAGREGSLLFWAWLLSLFTGYVAWRGLRDLDELTDMALAILNVIGALFLTLLIFSESNNPFMAIAPGFLVNGNLVGQAASWGMNPLLQHWAMILHPPTLFIGYAGLTVPFAYALATLIVDDSSARWVDYSDRITLFSWLFLGAGIGLGSVWAYVVLGWGGYWGWDPVENASILPWFVGVGMIHSFTMYRARGSFKRFALVLPAITFSMVILGTWITRSGLVQSVHAFAADAFSSNLLGMIIWGAPLLTGIGLALRWRSFGGDDEFESLTSREAAYYLNNVIMLIASLIIAGLTTSSWWSEKLFGNSINLGASMYELLARPVGLLYLFILAVCPLLSWKKTKGSTFFKKILWPSVGAVVIFAFLAWEWIVTLRPTYFDMVKSGGDVASNYLQFGQPAYDIITVAGFVLCAFLVANTIGLFARGVRGRMKAKGENAGVALWSVLTKARSQSGGYIAHIAISIIVIGLIGSSMYVRHISDEQRTVKDQPGQTIEISDYTLTYKGLDEKSLGNGDQLATAHFDVQRRGKPIGTVDPSMTSFATQGQTRLNAVVLSEPLRDIFVVFQGTATDPQTGETTLSMDVRINPLIWFVWVGFGMLLVGTLLACWPKKKAYAIQ